MKGIQGLILAIGLGIAGALFNWAYLYRASEEIDLINVIGIAPRAEVRRGEPLDKGTHLERIPVTRRRWESQLKYFAYKWDDLETVDRMPVYRDLHGGYLLLRDDLRTPPPEIRWEENLPQGTVERGIFVPFQTKNLVASLVNPGDYVDFVVSPGGTGGPTPATGGEPPPSEPPDIIGPFKILSLGNRLGSVEVMRAAGMTPTQENVMLISVKLNDGQMEPKAQKLWDLLHQTNFQQVGIMIRPRDEGK